MRLRKHRKNLGEGYLERCGLAQRAFEEDHLNNPESSEHLTDGKNVYVENI